MRGVAFLVALLGLFGSCTCDAPAEPIDPLPREEPLPRSPGPAVVAQPDGVPPGTPALYLAIGDDVPPAVKARLQAHLVSASALPVVDAGTIGPPHDAAAGSRALAFGDTEATRALLSPAALAALPEEGFAIKSGVVNAVPTIVEDGAGRGAAFGAYALLEELGFAFLHPLAPLRPTSLPADWPALDDTRAPRWPIRNIHVHTMHPLELTELLNGWPIEDADTWAARLPEWDAFLEWMLGNGNNEVEWVLLEAASWSDYAASDERQRRLRVLVERAHGFGLRAGADVPIALVQQHTFRLMQQEGELDDELSQIRARLDWLMGAGFDFVSTENGSTEFTHPEPSRMLAWMDEVARHLDEAWARDARIKIHTSTGQTADGYVDPETGGPLDFNHLPSYADARLGVMPHTVQHYGLDDPAPTYGNRDFSHVREYLHDEAGRRAVVWHPETAYWVSYDIDVPLFLPLYAERRLADLRLLARDEEAGLMGRGGFAGSRMDGQSVFSSGWEWGYWLNDVVAARAVWDPRLDVAEDAGALRAALEPLARALGEPAIADTLVEIARAQRELLIYGRTATLAPVDVTRRNGQAYLQGFEAFDDLLDAVNDLPLVPIEAPTTQPDRLGLVEMNNPLHPPPGYSAEVEPLLAAMETTFTAQADALHALRAGVRPEALELFDDLDDAMRMLALRARQVHGLYDYADGYWTQSDSERAPYLADARAALDEAALLVAAREPRYRVPADRIAQWRENPTAYEFTYLWTVRSLYFWWRDEHKAVDTPVSPCTYNIINPADVSLGEGGLVDAARVLREVTDGGLLDGVGECLAEPTDPPVFSRP